MLRRVPAGVATLTVLSSAPSRARSVVDNMRARTRRRVWGRSRCLCRAWLLHAWSGSAGVGAIVTALVLAASRPSVSAPISGGPIRRRCATCGLVARRRGRNRCSISPASVTAWLSAAGRLTDCWFGSLGSRAGRPSTALRLRRTATRCRRCHPGARGRPRRGDSRDLVPGLRSTSRTSSTSAQRRRALVVRFVRRAPASSGLQGHDR
jgi:hypothetical protein